MLNEYRDTGVQRTGHSADHGAAKSEAPASPAAANVRQMGIWVEGVDRLGAAYEGIWRVIKRFLTSSRGSGMNFSFVAPARFREEILEFLSDLPEDLRAKVDIRPFGGPNDVHEPDEAVRQSRYANHLDIDAWLVPNPMWGSAKHLTRPKLVWFHDFLLVEFPQSYPRKLFVEFQENVRDLADSGAFFIFTSPYVRQRHGRDVCGIPDEQSTLIINPPIEASAALEEVPEDDRLQGDMIREELRANLKQWCSPEHAKLFYHHISSYPFERVPYFFVSSQNREHKSFLRFAQTHAVLLRERYVPYSVFTTALVDVIGKSPLERFLNQDLLLGDFMSVGKVGETTHALLYKFAKLTIHPSTFEGNFPLPFAESVSVGTPCIMPYSRAYLDYVDKSMYPWIFYSPTSAGLIEKIDEVNRNRQAFVDVQSDLLEKLRRNTLGDFFKSHLNALDRSFQVQRRAFHYFLADREADVAKTRGKPPKGLSGLRSLSRSLLTHDPAIERVEPTLDVRMWKEFELATARKKEAPDGIVMHWASYLGDDHPKGGSYFFAELAREDVETASAELELGAELGSWVDGEYVVGSSAHFQFGGVDQMPADLRSSLSLAVPSLNDASRSIGWTRLTWSRGKVPELRISGKLAPMHASVKVQVGAITRFDRHFVLHPASTSKPADD